jgi:hypothetical protein
MMPSPDGVATMSDYPIHLESCDPTPSKRKLTDAEVEAAENKFIVDELRKLADDFERGDIESVAIVGFRISGDEYRRYFGGMDYLSTIGHLEMAKMDIAELARSFADPANHAEEV